MFVSQRQSYSDIVFSFLTPETTSTAQLPTAQHIPIPPIPPFSAIPCHPIPPPPLPQHIYITPRTRTSIPHPQHHQPYNHYSPKKHATAPHQPVPKLGIHTSRTIDQGHNGGSRDSGTHEGIQRAWRMYTSVRLTPSAGGGGLRFGGEGWWRGFGVLYR